MTTVSTRKQGDGRHQTTADQQKRTASYRGSRCLPVCAAALSLSLLAMVVLLCMFTRYAAAGSRPPDIRAEGCQIPFDVFIPPVNGQSPK